MFNSIENPYGLLEQETSQKDIRIVTAVDTAKIIHRRNHPERLS
ncbi:3293_t:CDS:2 [Gigaspora rosea]|nr:3293_t:CDS:2 [Gigaspora rosea]